MTQSIQKILFILAILYTIQVQASTAVTWACNSDILSDDNLCIWERDDGIPVGPHNIDRTADPDGEYKWVQDVNSGLLQCSGKAFGACQTLQHCVDPIEGNNVEFVRVFEMMAPIRDLVMFAPESIDDYFDTITEWITTCGIKTESDGNKISTTQAKAILLDPSSTGPITTLVMQWLEESQIAAVCIMSDTEDIDEQCEEYRDAANLSEGASSDCYETYYNSMPNTFDFTWHSTVSLSVCSYTAGSDCLTEGSDSSESSSGGGNSGGGDNEGGNTSGNSGSQNDSPDDDSTGQPGTDNDNEFFDGESYGKMMQVIIFSYILLFVAMI